MDRHGKYLSALGAWALAFGCAVGWGSFVMPGNTFLPLAGPLGSALGLGLGAVVMLIIAVNYHFLMNRYPDAGGTYTYTKKSFGYDHGFLSAWFLILTYVAIIWANATALPLIARTLLGNVFQFGFHYEIAGYHIYMGEMILAVGALVLAALVCLRRKAAEWTQIVMAVLLFAGVVICFVLAAARTNLTEPFVPAFSPQQTPLGGTFTAFGLAPWAYVGFESITHSAGEAKYNLKRSFGIMAVALVAAGIAYAVLNLLAVTALPEDVSTWTEYTDTLGERQGLASQPTFFAANSALGTAGSAILGVAALCGIFTGLIGNYIALSRLLTSLAEDQLLPGKIGELDKNRVPRRAILCILLVSVFLPFFGRTAISWIVDVTTVGATIAYAFASASAWKEARKQNLRLYRVTGMAG
ncbi:MAG: APC family permease, partial [Clostridia bacterium]|nr:APC family permease [Clostridia bacterium]